MRHLMAAVLAALALVAGPLRASIVTPTFEGTWSDDDKAVVNDAIIEWSQWFGDDDQPELKIKFVKGAVADPGNAETQVTATDGQGRPTDAEITVDAAKVNWTLGNPAAGQQDALHALKHEVGHAFGFGGTTTWDGGVTTDGGDTYIELNGQPGKQADDYDLKDDDKDHADAPTDLMYPEQLDGVRRHPGQKHADALRAIYGYRIVPEPATWAGLAVGLVLLRRRRTAQP